jgi:hypothetical protein
MATVAAILIGLALGIGAGIPVSLLVAHLADAWEW